MNNETLTYEKAMTRLENIVSQLEKNEASLEESIELFEEGTRLTAYCNELLKSAQQKITELTKE